MGYYVNPSSGSKESFLRSKGVSLPRAPKWSEIPKDKMAVCLVDNGFFTAAAIIYSEAELREFDSPADTRPKKWYLVPTGELLAVEPSLRRVVGG
jgi:hypothetical protein